MGEIFEGEEGHIIGWLILTALGIFTLFIHVRHLAEGGVTDLVVVFFDVFFPALISLSLVGAAGWIATTSLSGNEALKIGAWSLLGFILISLLVGAMTVYLINHPPNQSMLNTVMTVGSAGGIMGFVLGVSDVYSSRTRDKIKTQRDNAEQLNQQLTVLNRVFRHDIRQELTILKGNMTQLRSSVDDQDALLDTIDNHLDNIQTINAQIRELQTIIDSSSTIEYMNVYQVVQEVRASVLAEHPDVDIIVTGEKDAGVRASPQLHVAFTNIIENAIEHANENEINVTITKNSNTGRVDVTFVDHGPGIPPEELEVIRRENETQLQHSDGLGLWLVAWIVKESDGEVEVQSSDEGTTVTVSLDLVDSDTGGLLSF